MKRKYIIEMYSVLNQCKLTGMEAKQKIVLLKNLRRARPFKDAYDKDVQDAVERLKPENYDELMKKAQEHNESLQKGEKGMLSTAELEEIGKTLQTYNSELSDYANGLLEEEVEIEIERLSEDALAALIDANDMPAESLVTIYDALS